MALEPGDQLGSFELCSLLGSGGMGEVYEAKDHKLGRTVAIKVLQKEFATDPERLKRFELEARSASALDHPNIITIHDIAEVEGRHFIVMQYVEGKTLRELIGTRELTLSKSLHYAIQMADGLARAHSQGIVHRDLKPDNVMVNEDGLVKILDFGLAKLAEPSEWTEASTRDLEQPRTKEGHIVGTAPYMSPEQAKGQKVDARSDIFSFGSVLYEMVTRRRAFTGASITELLATIIRDEPRKPGELLPSVPLELERLIIRALKKEPERRFQSIADIRVELLEIKEELDSGSYVSADQVSRVRAKPRGSTWLWPAAGFVVIVVAVAGWLYLRPAVELPMRTIPLTTYPGIEANPAISPDGSQVAFTMRSGETGTPGLYVKLIDGGEPILISRGKGTIIYPTWSPDGNKIAFHRFVRGEDGEVARSIVEVSALGGAERQIATLRSRGGGALSWSPDGKLLAMVDRESAKDPDSVFLLSLETGERQRLTAPPPDFDGDYLGRFSPDGRTLAVVRQRVPNQTDIYLVPVTGGEPRQLTFDNRGTAGLDWTPDGRSIVFSSDRSGRAGLWSLWRVSASGGEPEPLEVGERAGYPTLSRQGGRLVYATYDRDWDIWRVGGPSARDEDKSPSRLIASSEMESYPHYSPDGRKISFTSTRSGNREIWICDSDGSNARQLTFLEDVTVDGNWSPDGKQIAFRSSKEGSHDIYVMNETGGFPRRLTTEASDEYAPRWSRDGRWIYFSSNRTGRLELYKVPSQGGKAIQLTRNYGTIGYESFDGQYLYFAKYGLGRGTFGIWRIPRDGGEEIQVYGRVHWRLWQVLEKGIYFINRDSAPSTVEFLDFATGETRQVAVLEGVPFGYGFSVSPDERWFLYQIHENEQDIMVVENFR